MSRNDQILVKEHEGRFYVFDVMAESWGETRYDEMMRTWVVVSNTNYLSLSDTKGSFPTREAAHKFARHYESLDDWGGSEYGVVDEVLFKDGAPVVITCDEPEEVATEVGA